jgi:putative hemolysin
MTTQTATPLGSGGAATHDSSVFPRERAPAIQVATPERPAIRVAWAQHLDEVRAAQRLRYDVFAGEMGARLNTPIAGHDIDLFDNFCEHLLVCDEASGQVIGTYRVLTPVQAQRVGSTYSDLEFDLTRLRGLRERMVELGRSCVHPDYRTGGVIMALWGALAEPLWCATSSTP